MEVHEDDQKYLTLSTHKGLFQPTRLMYGIASGPAKWQREIENLLRDIDGVTVFLDDIKITAPNDEIHLQRLELVLQRLEKHNMRVNFDKCEFMQESISYCGYRIDRHGIHKLETKIEAIRNLKEPTNKDEVRSFIGLINYYGRFFKDLSTVLFPLNNLLKDKVPFIWNEKCQRAFDEVKREIASKKHLVHYDPRLPLVLATDASPVGVGAVLSHIYPDGTEKPIQFASQTLTPTQQRYSQYDREAYAIIFGVKKFYQYVYARHFILQCDNKPVTQILSPEKGLPTLSATRMQHYAIYLSSFDYEIRYRKSSDHCNADALSRLPIAQTSVIPAEIDLIEVNLIENLPLTVTPLAEAMGKDETVSKLIHGLKFGKIVDKKDRFGVDQTEFALQEGCLLRGTRVYVPPPLRKTVLNELHEAHFGTSKMKSLARSYIWWPGLDSDIENITLNCSSCQENRRNPNKITAHIWETPDNVFDRVHIDFAGPFMGKYFFILVDAYSKWPEIYIMNQITTEATIKICRKIFATFGIPKMLVSDNGTQFTSQEFQHFLRMNGVVHRRSAPYHPATNGQAEKYVQILKDKLKALKSNVKNLDRDVAQILMCYRRMIHTTTGESPSQRMFNRQIRSRLDLFRPNVDKKPKSPSPELTRHFKVGDRVSVRDYYDKKYQFGRIHEVLGKLHYNVLLDDGRIWKRHIEQIHRIGEEIPVITHHSNVPVNINDNSIESNTNPIHTPTTTSIDTQNNQQSIGSSEPMASNTATTPEQTQITPNPIATGVPPILELRRSSRIRNETTRLGYNKNFEQI